MGKGNEDEDRGLLRGGAGRQTPGTANKGRLNGRPAGFDIADQATRDALEVLARSVTVAAPGAPVRERSRRRAASGAALSAGAESGAAFWDVWLRHQDHLLRQCLRIMSGNMADAEDALSSAMLRASSRYESYADEIVDERAWLSRLVRNSCIDHFRTEKRRQRLLEAHASRRARSGGDPGPARPPASATIEPSPEQKAIDRSLLSHLVDDIRRLPEHLRQPLMMRFLQDMSYAEIAETLSLTNAAVRKRIQLARQRLRRTRA